MDEISEIKHRLDIVDLVGFYVTLKKSGANFKGLCPFHHERTPSFMVNPERQIFKCFGCQKGGDIFSFIQEIEQIEFGDALKMLADRAGVTLAPKTKPKPGEAPSEKSRYYAINALANQFFHKILIEHAAGAAARDYLTKRGITGETIQRWRIGFAPRQKVLANLLVKRGYLSNEIIRAGKPDMFYDRIMFPIIDVMGNVVGFTGRILGQGEPKYLNTPETPIFHKSRILFGLEKAKRRIKELGQVIMTEGQMDVIAAHQAGTEQVVATSGTALTQDHLRILARYGADIVFAFDTDGAGEAATKKAIDMAISDGLSVKVIPIPHPYKDIGEMVQHDTKGWLELAERPVPAVEWQVGHVLARYYRNGVERKLSVDEKKQVAKELIPVLKRIPDVIEQAHYVQLLAKRLGVKEEIIQRAMQNLKKTATSQPTEEQKRRPTLTSREALLGLLELNLELRERHLDLYKRLILWYTKPIQDLVMAVSEQYKGLTPSELKEEIGLLVRRYQDEEKDKLKSDFAQKISEAEAAGDRAQVKALVAQFQQLLK